MLYNIEMAQRFSDNKINLKESFYKSFLVSYEEVLKFILENGLLVENKLRVSNIVNEATQQNWMNAEGFLRIHNMYIEKS
ncbi:MAG: hypothetical protein HRT72_07380 [Flavobacteriales bacterium]|nr:hypothetical protein [Flavobacteriales bacterium]